MRRYANIALQHRLQTRACFLFHRLFLLWRHLAATIPCLFCGATYQVSMNSSQSQHMSDDGRCSRKAQQRMVFMNEAFVFIFVSLFPKFVKYKILTINLKFVWKHLGFNNGGMISVCHGFFFLLSWIIMIVKEISTVCCLIFHTIHWQKYYFHKGHAFE